MSNQLDDSYAQELISLSLKDFVQYDLNGRWIVAKILKIHDGDTFTIGWKENDKFVKTSIRLAGIDAPELHSKNNNGLESKLCRLGRNWLISKYLNKLMTIQCLEMDKYGRLLANVFPYPNNGVSINLLMINNKFVRVYGGDLHKNDWTINELVGGLAVAESFGVKDD